MTSLPGCLWYGTPVKRAGKTFCSKTCTSRHRGEARGALRKQLNCEQCGGVFETWLHLEGTQRFCGKACEVEADHATLVARTGDLHPRFTANWHTCEECGRRFHRPASRAEAGTRFCSIACWRAAKSATVACAQCSDEFRVDRHREEDARFCSSSAKQTSGGLRTF